MSDQRLAVVLLKRLQTVFPMLKVKNVLADKGYDSLPVYQQVRDVGAYPLIDFIHHAHELPEGMDKHFRPICEAGHAYRYDSFDPKYNTLKFTRPEACDTCPLRDKACQKVHKIRIEEDLRKFTVPARGSQKYAELFKQRTAVERVFAYLKLYFGMTRTRHRGTRAQVDFELSCLTYNLCKFALDKLNKSLQEACSHAA